MVFVDFLGIFFVMDFIYFFYQIYDFFIFIFFSGRLGFGSVYVGECFYKWCQFV